MEDYIKKEGEEYAIFNDDLKDSILDYCDINNLKHDPLEHPLTKHEPPKALTTYLETDDIGIFLYEIKENSSCRFSTSTGWHLLREHGAFSAKLAFEQLNPGESMIIRCVLIRKDDAYRHYMVDTVCKLHQKGNCMADNENVLQPTSGQSGMWFYSSEGPRKSLCFEAGNPDPKGSLECTISMKSACNSTCNTCTDETFRPTMRSRDLLLILTLEDKSSNKVLARRSISLWPKSVIRESDLDKESRWRPRGAVTKEGPGPKENKRAGHRNPHRTYLTSSLKMAVAAAKYLNISKGELIDIMDYQYDEDN